MMNGKSVSSMTREEIIRRAQADATAEYVAEKIASVEPGAQKVELITRAPVVNIPPIPPIDVKPIADAMVDVLKSVLDGVLLSVEKSRPNVLPPDMTPISEAMDRLAESSSRQAVMLSQAAKPEPVNLHFIADAVRSLADAYRENTAQLAEVVSENKKQVAALSKLAEAVAKPVNNPKTEPPDMAPVAAAIDRLAELVKKEPPKHKKSRATIKFNDGDNSAEIVEE